jgi:hypothetical protein
MPGAKCPMSERRYFEHYTTDEPPRLDRWYCCECCGYPTLWGTYYEDCQVCDWYDVPWGDGGSGPEDLTEARENFRAYLTKYRPGSNAFKAHDLESERAAKRELMQAYDAYMAEPDLRRRTALWAEVHHLGENFPLGIPAAGRHLLIGGLVAMGFDATGRYLLTVTHSGRGVFNTRNWERVARDTTVAYPTDGKAIGIGPIAGQVIGVQELDERRDRIEMRSPVGRFHLVGESNGITVTRHT